MNNFKVKITEDAVNTDLSPEQLIAMGYRKVSNAYCHVSRIDREDWMTVLAKQLRCAVADFYNLDGSGVSGSWCDYYRRTHSKDVLTVSPSIIGKIPSSSFDPVGFIKE